MGPHHVNVCFRPFDGLQHPLELSKGQEGWDVWKLQPHRDGFSFEHLKAFVIEHRTGSAGKIPSRKRNVTTCDSFKVAEAILLDNSFCYPILDTSQIVEVEFRRT